MLAVGSTVIDLTPTPLKEWAIAQFGTHDKAILVGSVLLGVLVLAAVAGLLAARRFAYGAALLVALVAIPAAARRPDLLPSLVAGVVGVGALVVADPRRAVRPAAAAAGAGRRGVLIAAGTARGRRGRDGRRRPLDHVVPHPGHGDRPAGRRPTRRRRSRPAWTTGSPASRRFRTPTDDFYRVDTRLTLPVVDADDWTLTIDGDVDARGHLHASTTCSRCRSSSATSP